MDCADAFRRLICVSENTPISSVPISSTANASAQHRLHRQALELHGTRAAALSTRRRRAAPLLRPVTNPAPCWLPSETAFIFPVPTFRTAGKVGSGIAAYLSGSTAAASAIFNAARACRPRVARSSTRRLVSCAPATVLYMAKNRRSAFIRRLASHAWPCAARASRHRRRCARLPVSAQRLGPCDRHVRFATKLVLTIHSSHIKLRQTVEDAGIASKCRSSQRKRRPAGNRSNSNSPPFLLSHLAYGNEPR